MCVRWRGSVQWEKNESLNDNDILWYDRTNTFYHISAKRIMICSTWNFYLTMCICALEVKTQFKTESELHSETSVLQRALHHHHLHLYGIWAFSFNFHPFWPTLSTLMNEARWADSGTHWNTLCGIVELLKCISCLRSTTNCTSTNFIQVFPPFIFFCG